MYKNKLLIIIHYCSLVLNSNIMYLFSCVIFILTETNFTRFCNGRLFRRDLNHTKSTVNVCCVSAVKYSSINIRWKQIFESKISNTLHEYAISGKRSVRCGRLHFVYRLTPPYVQTFRLRSANQALQLLTKVQ